MSGEHDDEQAPGEEPNPFAHLTEQLRQAQAESEDLLARLRARSAELDAQAAQHEPPEEQA